MKLTWKVDVDLESAHGSHGTSYNRMSLAAGASYE